MSPVGRTNAGQLSGIRASKERMVIALHDRASRLPEAGTIDLLAC
jgi:hypothetical protein